MASEVRLEAVIARSPSQLWSALTNRAAIAEWLLPNDFAATAGRSFSLVDEASNSRVSLISCKVLEAFPPSLLSFTWHEGRNETVVRFFLSRTKAGSRLTVEQRGFRGLSGLIARRRAFRMWGDIIERKLVPAADRLEEAAPVRESPTGPRA